MEYIVFYEVTMGKKKIHLTTGERMVELAVEAARLNLDFRVKSWHFPLEYAQTFLNACRGLGYE